MGSIIVWIVSELVSVLLLVVGRLRSGSDS
jgi:hypothetical protein